METKEKVVEEPYGFIYITTNMVNGMRYLGQKRIEFGKDWYSYLGSGKYLKRAIKKYGRENFIRNIVCFCYSEDELNKSEYDLSVFLDVVESDDWYNLCYGGGTTNGYHHSEESKKKMSDNSKNPSKETRIKMSESAKARCTEEWRRVASERSKGKWAGENNPNYGNQRWTGKNNPNYGNHKLAGKNNPRARKVICLSDLKLYDYVNEAAYYNGISKNTMRKRCKQHKDFMYYDEWLTLQNDLENIND